MLFAVGVAAWKHKTVTIRVEIDLIEGSWRVKGEASPRRMKLLLMSVFARESLAQSLVLFFLECLHCAISAVFLYRDFLRSFIPILFATAAFWMGVLGNFYCETIAFSAASELDLPTLLFGVFYYKGYEVVQLQPDNRTVIREKCFMYPSGTAFDAKWKTAKSFAVITAISTYLLLL